MFILASHVHQPHLHILLHINDFFFFNYNFPLSSTPITKFVCVCEWEGITWDNNWLILTENLFYLPQFRKTTTLLIWHVKYANFKLQYMRDYFLINKRSNLSKIFRMNLAAPLAKFTQASFYFFETVSPLTLPFFIINRV